MAKIIDTNDISPIGGGSLDVINQIRTYKEIKQMWEQKSDPENQDDSEYHRLTNGMHIKLSNKKDNKDG
jgi:hypothetical protein